ncbi:MAG: glucose-6-phosphate dehydrogenase [Alphaproteobacteria bacterium]|nr:glucose-6-phosphate dehydrogenase [Alphaproteobacteria bacterium]
MSETKSASEDAEASGVAAIVVFGATGDLAMRMLWPSLFHLHREGRLPEDCRLVGCARLGIPEDEFRTRVRADVAQKIGPDAVTGADWRSFAKRIVYLAIDATDADQLSALRAHAPPERASVMYLAVSPALFGRIALALGDAGLVGPGTRLALEKPIGGDRESAAAINADVARHFSERQVFRVDHYLGKEAVQNLIALRFANALFEPIWNRECIDHVQICIGETIGVDGRTDYYDAYGALRDMVQNHLIQLLCLVAMEPPYSLDQEAVRDEKVKVLRALKPPSASEIGAVSVRGQYGAGYIDGVLARSYVEEAKRPSGTETYVALKVEIDNWRWAGVPFYVRTGKRLGERRTYIVVSFRNVPHSIFAGSPLANNELVIELQPDEEIALRLMNKAPGIGQDGMTLQAMSLDLSLSDSFKDARRRIAYERLFVDMIEGRTTLFVRGDEVEAAWSWVDQISEAWKQADVPCETYPAGSWGPASARALIARDGRAWRD